MKNIAIRNSNSLEALKKAGENSIKKGLNLTEQPFKILNVFLTELH